MVHARADKGWAVKRAHPSKKVWCSGLGLRLEMSLVFDFGQGLRCGLYIRHCRCHWIMVAWFVFLHLFLISLCWYAVSERQMLLFFAGGLVGVDKHLFQRVSFIIYRSNRSFNMPPRAYPGHLTPLPSREGGNLIIRVFQGVGNHREPTQ